MFSFAAFFVYFRAESGQPVWPASQVLQRRDLRFADSTLRVLYQIGYESVEHALQGLVELQLLRYSGILLLGLAVKPVEDADLAPNLRHREQLRFIAVIQVGGVVGDLIGKVYELRLQRRAQVEQVLRELGMLADRIIAGVLDDAFPHFESEIQPAKVGVADFEVFNNAQRLKIVVKEFAMLPHQSVERVLARMAEWRMPNVMHQGQGLNQIDVK